MQTVAVVPVLPHGVVQLGSSLPVSPYFCLFLVITLQNDITVSINLIRVLV